MNIGHDNGSPGSRSSRNRPDARDFDATLRRLHAQAVEHVPARTLMQLRPQRATTAATKPRLFAWPLAATCAIALVAGGLFLRYPSQTIPADTAPAVAITDSEPGDVYAALDESPELYLWLASNDTTSLVTE
jgi:anti-sigma factor RsiW